MKIGNLVGLVGWRGMVGSVLIDRMQAEGDFELIEPVFFSTSNAGGAAPALAKNETTLQDAFNIDALKRCDIIISAQGGDYTTEVFPKLRATGWRGHWIDAASTLRMDKDAVIILDPVNLPVIQAALARGGNVKTKYQYQYKDASNPRNFVRTSTTFTPVGGSNLTQQQTWQCQQQQNLHALGPIGAYQAFCYTPEHKRSQHNPRNDTGKLPANIPGRFAL